MIAVVLLTAAAVALILSNVRAETASTEAAKEFAAALRDALRKDDRDRAVALARGYAPQTHVAVAVLAALEKDAEAADPRRRVRTLAALALFAVAVLVVVAGWAASSVAFATSTLVAIFATLLGVGLLAQNRAARREMERTAAEMTELLTRPAEAPASPAAAPTRFTTSMELKGDRYSVSNAASKAGRKGRCPTCRQFVDLIAAREVIVDWDGSDAYHFYCPRCYRGIVGNDYYVGLLRDPQGEPIVDQHNWYYS